MEDMVSRKKIIDRPHLGIGRVKLIEKITKHFHARQALQIPANVFACGAHTGEFAIQPVMVCQVLKQPLLDLLCARCRAAQTGFEVVGDVAKNPGAALRRAAGAECRW